ncbi:hypothetical protein NYO67_934 [Aspergillus flavus]|nr:hypothetical protein NYO67_934 [Aspergillus flavus]
MIPHMNTLTPEPNVQWHLHREMMLFHLATLQTLNFVKERDLDSCITYQFREYTIVLGYPHTQPLALDRRNIAKCRVDAFHSSEFMISLCPTNLSAESLLTPTTGTRPSQVVTSMAAARPAASTVICNNEDGPWWPRGGGHGGGGKGRRLPSPEVDPRSLVDLIPER